LLKKHIGPHADQCKLRGSKQDTGDGLRMALEIGAKAVNMKYFYGHLISRKALVDDRFWPYPRLDGFVDEGILVNREGMRFVDEGRGDVAVANELARTENVTGAVLIFGDESWQAAKDDNFSNLVKTPAPNPWLMDHGGEIFRSETIEGLAQVLGMTPCDCVRPSAITIAPSMRAQLSRSAYHEPANPRFCARRTTAYEWCPALLSRWVEFS